jgi:hypothetical protein
VSTLSRVDVKADLERARMGPTVMSAGEATVFIDRPATEQRLRDDVRAEARAMAQGHAFSELYVGGV